METQTLVVKVNHTEKIKLDLPFFGKVPNRKHWIRITDDDPPQITTINLMGEGCDVFQWRYPEFIDIQDFEPCSAEEWINAKYEAAGYCLTLKIK